MAGGKTGFNYVLDKARIPALRQWLPGLYAGPNYCQSRGRQ